MRNLAIVATTLAIAALTTAVIPAGPLSGPAHAQQNSTDPLQLKYAAEAEEKARIEREYNAMMQKTQRGAASEGKIDPWARVRAPQTPVKDKR